MDENRFDALSRLVAAATTRRRLVATAAAAIFGGTLASGDDASARPAICRPGGRYCTWNHQCCNNQCRTGKRFPHRTRNVCECTAPDGWCNNKCTKLGTDRRNCGSCGNVCLPGEVCHDGACWRQFGQTCGLPETRGHACDTGLTCDHTRNICVGDVEWIGCDDDDDNCDHDLVCVNDTCWAFCDELDDCGEGFACNRRQNACVYDDCIAKDSLCRANRDCCYDDLCVYDHGFEDYRCNWCVDTGQSTCITNEQCCWLSDSCVDGKCCLQENEGGCARNVDCCGDLECQSGTCVGACTPSGQACSKANDNCCVAFCNNVAGLGEVCLSADGESCNSTADCQNTLVCNNGFCE